MPAKKKIKRIISAKKCVFCQSGSFPDYKEPEILKNYITERGKIVGRDRSGLCARHQRHLSTAVKRARYLALLPFATRVK